MIRLAALLASPLWSDLRPYLTDESVSELVLNAPGVVFIEQAGGFHRHEMPALTVGHLYRLFALIANYNQQVLNASHPILSGAMGDDLRVQLVIPPVSRYPIFAIRKKKKNPLALSALVAQDFFKVPAQDPVYSESHLVALYQAEDWDAFVPLAVAMQYNILISGSTSSGKTTLLNALLSSIPADERLIILEDTAEVSVTQSHVVSLLTATSSQGPAVTMQQLVQCSLRMRPDRLIVGEIRGGELFDFVTASLTGHRGLMATLHAESPAVAFTRMSQLYKLGMHSVMQESDIQSELRQAVDIILQIKKTSAGRRLTAVYFKGY